MPTASHCSEPVCLAHQVTSWEPIVAYPAYFAGALAFNINCVAAFLAHEPLEATLLEWLPACLGSACFVLGGACECHRNADMLARGELLRAAVVQSVFDFLGGVLFLLAAASGIAGVEEPLYHWLVDLAYLAGSVAFLVASVAGLWMWKGDQFGLALIPEIYIDDGTQLEPAEYALHQQQLAQVRIGLAWP